MHIWKRKQIHHPRNFSRFLIFIFLLFSSIIYTVIQFLISLLFNILFFMKMQTALLPHDQVHSHSERKTKLEMGHMPNLEKIYVSNCALNDELFLEEGDQMRIRHFPTIDGYLFPKLTSLTMQKCHKIKVLLSLSSFECLEKLEVYNCENLKEII